MPHIEPLKREELAEFEPLFAIVEQTMGFVPNSMLTMGRRPDLLRAFAALAATVMASGSLDPGLKQLVAFVASNASGCRYCQAHTSHSAVRTGVAEEKLAAAFEFESNTSFDDAERAALRLARDAARVPNAVAAAHFDALHQHFRDEQIVEMMAVVSLFGFLNRWNDTLATALEKEPLAFARRALASAGWQPAKHAD